MARGLRAFARAAALVVFFGAPLGAAQATLISGPVLRGVSASGITITWETDVVSLGGVRLRPEGGAWRTLDDERPRALHSLAPVNLAPDTFHEYRVLVNGTSVAEGRFRTACGRGTSFRFAAYGSSRGVPAAHARVARSVLRHSPRARFLLHTGDLTDRGGVRAQWQTQFLAPARELLAQLPLAAVHGNRDRHSPFWNDLVGFPGTNGLWYSFEYGDATFLVLDSESPFGEDSRQLKWFLRTARRAATRWRIVAMHRSLLTGSAADRADRRRLLAACEAMGVDVVLTGDAHAYGRSLKDGVLHLNTGGGGALIAPVRLSRDADPYQQAYRAVLHHLEFLVEPDRLTAEVVLTTGKVLEHTIIEKAGKRRTITSRKGSPKTAPLPQPPAEKKES